MSSRIPLPTMHLSIRVPWDEHQWIGADSSLEDNRAFMSPTGFSYEKEHPYDAQSYQPAVIQGSEYSAVAIPFRWMLKDQLKMMSDDRRNAKGPFDPVAWYGIPFDREIESQNKYSWIQHPKNQEVMLTCFASAIVANESLVFFYANDLPLTTDPRRVIVGVGLVNFVGILKQYPLRDGSTKPGCFVWERTIGHTIRPDDFRGHKGGFLLPYNQTLEWSRDNSNRSPERYVAYAPDDAWENFSFASEHLPHDTAITALLECKGVFERLTSDQVDIPGRWNFQINWIDEQLNRLWKMRGPYPGMGSVLSAFGIENGTLVAYEINRIQQEASQEYGEDPWDMFEQALDDPDLVPNCIKYLENKKALWNTANESDRRRLKILSRFSINKDQASKYINRAQAAAIEVNPYLLYEQDRFDQDGISLRTIDRGMLNPDTVLQERFPLPEPARMNDSADPRRVRAFCVYCLEDAAMSEGHSLLGRDLLMERLDETDLATTPLPMNDFVLDLAQQSFEGTIEAVTDADGMTYYQLSYITECVKRIDVLKRRLEKGRPHEGTHDWRHILDEEFGTINGASEEQQLEQLSRIEKTEALTKLYRSRLSVLVGGAGTGKTTLLKLLCNATDIKSDVLLLAPTGKARVRMETQVGVTRAHTIAQFLYRFGLYDGHNDRYLLAERSRRFDSIPSTVIVDECSTLTEPQLASLLSVVKSAHRIVFVGDPQQLPPIGTGRPFVDITEFIKENYEESAYCELTISLRQRGEDRDDLALANWFGRNAIPAGDDDIWQKIQAGEANHVRAIRWDEPQELQDIVLGEVREYLSTIELAAVSLDELERFAFSLGGAMYGQDPHPFFNHRHVGKMVESWQILSPLRGGEYGVRALNRAVQNRFRRDIRMHVNERQTRYRKFPPPIGNEEILYGDKVINVVNGARSNDPRTDGRIFPDDENALRYVANGEIGVIVGERRTQRRRIRPENLEVEFASQLNYKYTYFESEFSEHRTSPLELAYALTIHKVQGSEFGVVFLVIPNESPVLSRELLYTALTRHETRVIILHQGEFLDLRRYSDSLQSSIYRRTTNLFRTPEMQPVTDDSGESIYMEDKLIHKTARGDRVRSKSEVIIADKLEKYGLEWHYERSFEGRYPDFTVEDHETGRTVFWEHLGLLHIPHYRRKWEAKRKWYIDQGVVPYDSDEDASSVLVTTRDDENGGINSLQLDALITEVFDLD